MVKFVCYLLSELNPAGSRMRNLLNVDYTGNVFFDLIVEDTVVSRTFLGKSGKRIIRLPYQMIMHLWFNKNCVVEAITLLIDFTQHKLAMMMV